MTSSFARLTYLKIIRCLYSKWETIYYYKYYDNFAPLSYIEILYNLPAGSDHQNFI